MKETEPAKPLSVLEEAVFITVVSVTFRAFSFKAAKISGVFKFSGLTPVSSVQDAASQLLSVAFNL